MNFLLRSSNHVAAEQVAVAEPPSPAETVPTSRSSTTLVGLIAEESFQFPASDDRDQETDDNDGTGESISENLNDVSEEEGWITIPFKELPDDWNIAPDIHSFRPLDRSFVFPGEQVHVLACLSACKQDTEIITPFKVAAVIRSSRAHSPDPKNGNLEDKMKAVAGEGVNPGHQNVNGNGEKSTEEKFDLQTEISASESFLRMEDHRRQTETILQKFKNSHFFVRIAESNESLWSKKRALEALFERSNTDDYKNTAKTTEKNTSCATAVIDRGNFDANASGGVARDSVKCCSLPNGDIVVILQVNVGIDSLKDPVIEILQFEKFEENKLSENQDNKVGSKNSDLGGELLKWLLPLDNTVPPPSRALSPPRMNSSSGSVGTGPPGSSHTKSGSSGTSGSQLFSFGHFRSYSMSSLPQNTAPPYVPVKAQSSKPTFDIEDWDEYLKGQRTGKEGLLSFRGVTLERERFSVRCGLEGIYVPGRRWRRKLEIIQPVEIHSSFADCNTDDLLCIQIKNVAPAHTPDIVIYIDAITIVFEEAAEGGPHSSLPVACIEAGNDYSLPNLALRRGEEHSFILKPASSMSKNLKGHGERSSQVSGWRRLSQMVEGKKTLSPADQYAIMVSCRCNYTESRLFFKQPTAWRPRASRDLMISVATDISQQSCVPNERVTQLPVQVLTLQASNMTPEDLTLTVLAPTSFTLPPSVVSLSSSPTESPFAGRGNVTQWGSPVQRLVSVPVPLVSGSQKHTGDDEVKSISVSTPSPKSDAIPNTGLGCTHLWLQSRVPLGCVPSHSTATIKLELLPLTDGIITLDTLHIDVKEKGVTYIPEHSLKITATSSISTGVY